MKILFLGDVVGPAGCNAIKIFLPNIVKKIIQSESNKFLNDLNNYSKLQKKVYKEIISSLSENKTTIKTAFNKYKYYSTMYQNIFSRSMLIS